ncbi:MAG: hypothetical protein OQK82_07185, partial [Candidatus Pacearchaeota archaeon]|nr:hypothetical protein [Candidatus Pacearchaeota archaeon]
MEHISKRIYLKNTLLILIPSFVLFSIILWLYYLLEVNSEKRICYVGASNVVEHQRLRTASNFDLIVADLQFFANYSQIVALLTDPMYDMDRLKNDFALFSRGAKIYDQVRIIDSSGMEIIRVNFSNKNGPVIVNGTHLQNKKDRYYFKDTYELQKNEIFISPLDLNIEHGEIERPFKPMIRFGTPIFGKNGTKCGIIIFNYLADFLLNDIRKIQETTSGKS